jgi:fructose/tagatose bisphosphate aldolase
MPLARVRDLVRHASRHGYLVASFKVHGADEVQAVVNAAEAVRAPAIVAVDERGSALLRCDIALAVAESVAAAAAVPIAVEVVSHARDGGLIGSRTDGIVADAFSPGGNTSPYDLAEERDRMHEADAPDCEMWFALPAAAAEIAEAAAAGCRLGLSAGGTGDAELRPAVLRKQLQSLRARHQAALVADGDLPWSSSAFRSLPGLGIAKINFDKRLAQVMAKANRRAAQKTGDQYRVAMKETFAALTEEVIECLHRAGGSGRAADVMACAGDDLEPAPAALPRPVAERAARRARVA